MADDTRITEAMMPDEETVARAALTFCLDGAEAQMHALVVGAGGAVAALRLLEDASGEGDKRLDEALVRGVLRWSGRPSEQGMADFHRSVARWRDRLAQLPTQRLGELATWFTMEGRQWIIAPHHPCWPHQLDDLTVRTEWAPPLCLWGRGDPGALASCERPVGVVGSRVADDYGRAVAHSVGEAMARRGHLVVSGGAMGVDAAAHWGALNAIELCEPGMAGRTAAVFAGGLNHLGPSRNTRLFERIESSGGALISEMCPGTIPEARRFLLRNRIIAALSSTVVAAQARLRSGALNTAGWACELGRDLLAAPGDITMPANAGCNRIICEGKARILASLGELDDLTHAPHPPFGVVAAGLPPASQPTLDQAANDHRSVSESNDVNDTDSTGNANGTSRSAHAIPDLRDSTNRSARSSEAF